MTDDDLMAELQELKKKYESELPEKMAEIRQKLDEIVRQWEPGPAKELRDMLHKLAGSGGNYGFVTMGQKAREAETMMKTHGYDTPLPAEDMAKLAGLVREVEAASTEADVENPLADQF